MPAVARVITENVAIAVQGIAANRLRSALTMLGILIGVGSVIVLVAVGNRLVGRGAEAARGTRHQHADASSRRGGFGGAGGAAAATGTQSQAGHAHARPTSPRSQDPVNAPDVGRGRADRQRVADRHLRRQHVHAGPVRRHDARTTRRSPNYSVAQGSFFTDRRRRSAPQGRRARPDRRDEPVRHGVNPVGDTRAVRQRHRSSVIGVLTPKGTNGVQDQDDIAITPITAVQDTLTGATRGYSSITLQADVERSARTRRSREVESILDSRHPSTTGTPTSRCSTRRALLSTSNSTNHVLTVLLGAVAAISLLVGGIGVMNIMLVTVTERTREIGIRKAIGARRSDILGQFLVEAVLLSLLGGIAGVVAGLVGSRFRIVGIQPVVQLYSVALAFGVALLVGLFFGIYPANRAASLRPIEALRYE